MTPIEVAHQIYARSLYVIQDGHPAWWPADTDPVDMAADLISLSQRLLSLVESGPEGQRDLFEEVA